MKQVHTIEQPTFDLPHYTPGEVDYMAQAHTEEMYAFVHLFRQHTPLFGLPETYALSSFYLKRHPYGKTGRKQKAQGQQLLDDLLKPNNGKTPIWQPPCLYNEDACTC